MRMMLLWALLLFFSGYAFSVQLADSRAARTAEATTQAESLASFTGFVSSHLKAGNTLAEGVTPGSAIPRPSWYVLKSTLKVSTHNGNSYSFMEMPDEGTATRVANALGVRMEDMGNLVAGRNAAGSLVRIEGSTGNAVTLPSDIPDNAVVILAQ